MHFSHSPFLKKGKCMKMTSGEYTEGFLGSEKKKRKNKKKRCKNGKQKKYGLPHQPYSFFGSCVPKSCHNGKILNDTFRVDSFASTGFSAIGV